MAEIRSIVIPPDGEVEVRLIPPSEAVVSQIIFGHGLGHVGEFGFNNVLMLVDECAGDNEATAIPNPRATQVWNKLSGKSGELDPFDNPILGTVVLVGRDFDENYTSIALDIMDYIEEAPVAKSTRKDIERELQLAEDLHAQLGERIPQLRAELAKAIPSEPVGGTRWSVEVKFALHGKKYEFLLLRSPRGEWYTTGTAAHTKRFVNWAALVAWLQGPDVHWHSELFRLVKDGMAYRFADSAVVRVDAGEPPF